MSATTTHSSPQATAKPRLLLLDDSDIVRDAMTSYFTSRQCEVVAAASVDEAKRHFEQIRPNYFIIDYSLESDEISGIDVADLLSLNVREVTITTGSRDDDVIVKILQRYHLLRKPFGTDKLDTLMDRISYACITA